ncbi:MAG: C40 family peptidase [Arenimonas sp.]
MNLDAHYPQPMTLLPVKSRCLALSSALLMCILSACATTQSPHKAYGSSQTHRLEDSDDIEIRDLSQVSNEVIFRAISLVGTPYRYGGSHPDTGLDCSGLIDFVFREAAGLKLPRTTRELIDIDAKAIDRDDLQAGDLVYFNSRGGRVSHIGIYVGENRFVHAPSTGGVVRIDKLNTPYWTKFYVGAKRVLM